MRLFLTACAALVLALPTAGCATALPGWVPRNDKGVLADTIMDEQALTLLYGTATLVNISIANAADARLITVAQGRQAEKLKADLKGYLLAAQRAYDAGEAKTYREKIAAATATITAINKLLPKPEIAR